jgi:hypothetical protein
VYFVAMPYDVLLQREKQSAAVPFYRSDAAVRHFRNEASVAV